MTCLWHVRAELTEAAVEAARKSPVSRTISKRPSVGWSFAYGFMEYLSSISFLYDSCALLRRMV